MDTKPLYTIPKKVPPLLWRDNQVSTAIRAFDAGMYNGKAGMKKFKQRRKESKNG